MEVWPALVDISALATWYQALGSWGVILSALVMVACALTVLPAEVSAIANGMVYGAYWGALLSWASALLGANIAFGLARAAGPRSMTKFAGTEHFDRVNEWSRSNGAWVLLLARCVPVIPFFALNYAAGLSGMRWSTYNLVTAVGILPAIVLLSFLGEGALDMHWSVWIAAATILFIIGWVAKQLFDESAPKGEDRFHANPKRLGSAVSSFASSRRQRKRVS